MAISPSRTVTVTIRGPLERTEIPGLFARTCALLAAGDVELLRCQMAGVVADAVALDALARLALAARRRGCDVELCGASEELRALIELVGLADVLRRESRDEPAARSRAAAASRRAGRSSRWPGRT